MSVITQNVDAAFKNHLKTVSEKYKSLLRSRLSLYRLEAHQKAGCIPLNYKIKRNEIDNILFPSESLQGQFLLPTGSSNFTLSHMKDVMEQIQLEHAIAKAQEALVALQPYDVDQNLDQIKRNIINDLVPMELQGNNHGRQIMMELSDGAQAALNRLQYEQMAIFIEKRQEIDLRLQKKSSIDNAIEDMNDENDLGSTAVLKEQQLTSIDNCSKRRATHKTLPSPNRSQAGRRPASFGQAPDSQSAKAGPSGKFGQASRRQSKEERNETKSSLRCQGKIRKKSSIAARGDAGGKGRRNCQ